MNGTSGFQEVRPLRPNHQRIASWTSDGINSYHATGALSVLSTSSFSPQGSARSENRFLSLFSCFQCELILIQTSDVFN